MKWRYFKITITLGLFLGVFNLGFAQKKINSPSSIKIKPENSDVRSWANNINGQTLKFESDSWSIFGTCWYWGLKDTIENVINGANNQPPNMNCSGLNRLVLYSTLTKADSGILIFTGNTNYKFLTSTNTNNYTTRLIPIRLTVNLKDTSGKFMKFSRFDSGYFARANSNFKIKLLLEAFGPSDALNCSTYGSCNKWIPAITLFNNLHTDPYTSICTSLNYSQFWEVNTFVTTTNEGPYCEGEKIKLKANTQDSGYWSLNSDTLGFSKEIVLENISDTEKFLFTAMGKFGCFDTSYNTVLIHPKPTVLFSVNNSEQCQENNSFIFTNESFISSGNLKFNWQIPSPENKKDSQTNFNYSFSKSGEFAITLTATSDKFCQDSISKNIQVWQMPNFSAKIDSVCITDSAKFTLNLGIARDSITEIKWLLPDNASYNSEAFNYKFTQSGLNKIIVYSITNRNCIQNDTLIHPVFSIPKSNFSTTPAMNFCTGDLIQFQSTSSNDFGKIKNLHWNFGDNQKSTDSLILKSYKVSKTTTYNVRLLVIGEGNCYDSIIKTVDIEEMPKTCMVSANVDYTTYFYGLKVQPRDSLGNIGGQNDVEYTFEVEGVNSIKSNGINAMALFQLPNDGTYKVKVTAQNNSGAKCKCESNWIDFTINRLSEDSKSIVGLHIYPNPTNSKLIIRNEVAFPLKLCVKTISGQPIMYIDSEQPLTVLNVSELPTGIYELHVNSLDKNQVLKFIKL